MYSTVASPMRVGNSMPVFCCGMPMAVVGPVAETKSPILIWAVTPAANNAHAIATTKRQYFMARLQCLVECECYRILRQNRIPARPGMHSRRVSRRPRPLEIVAAEPARPVDDFADEMKPRHVGGTPRFTRQSARGDTAQRDLGLVVAERARWKQRPTAKPRREIAQTFLRELLHWQRAFLCCAPRLHE